MEFLPWLATGDSPLVAFGGSDGVIRTLSMMTWKLAARCMGGHKGSISCMMTFLTSSCEALLISGGSDGLLIIWNALETHHGHGVRDLVAKLSMKVYCMVAHPLQPHLVATGTNVGVIVSEFDPESLPPVTPLLMSAESRNLSAVCILAKELKLLNFHLSNTTDPSLGNNSSLSETGNLKGDSLEPLHVTQTRKRINAPVPHDSYSVLSVSSSGKYVAIVWPDIPYFSIYKVSNWSIVDSGSARLLAWDTCCDRFAILESTLPPRMPIIPKGSSSRKAKEAAAAAAQAAAAAAAANSASANVQVRILLDDGTSNILMRSIGSRNEPVVGLYGGALFGIAYRTSPRNTLGSATTISTIQSMPVSGFGSYDDGFSSQRSTAEAATLNFQFFR
ncbi:hypothetical protein ERO13_A08G023424v2 [Gossypium hirsutum]|nr:hypothetical protein ERO13_A08G023424v2 [Gossypium hirsutum]